MNARSERRRGVFFMNNWATCAVCASVLMGIGTICAGQSPAHAPTADASQSKPQSAAQPPAARPETMGFPFDPPPVPRTDGRVRLYFTSRREGPGKDGKGELPAIYSGVSEDGVRFTFEPGVRFGVDGKVVIDCAAALHEGKVHL